MVPTEPFRRSCKTTLPDSGRDHQAPRTEVAETDTLHPHAGTGHPALAARGRVLHAAHRLPWPAPRRRYVHRENRLATRAFVAACFPPEGRLNNILRHPAIKAFDQTAWAQIDWMENAER